MAARQAALTARAVLLFARLLDSLVVGQMHASAVGAPNRYAESLAGFSMN